MDFEMTAEDIKVFLDEAEEQLQLMESTILKLEKEGKNNPEHLQEIFRAAHTLKGSSATLGHKQMAEVTHAMENVLDKLRKGKLAVSTRVVDTLFACLDVLQAYKEEIATGEASGVKSVEIVARLSAIDEQQPVVQELPRPTDVRLASSVPHVPPLTPDEQALVATCTDEGRHPVWAVVRLNDGSMSAVRAFQALLVAEEAGVLIRSWPSQREIESDQVGAELKLLVATAEPPERLWNALSAIPEIAIASVEPMQASELATLPLDEVAAATFQANEATFVEGTVGQADPHLAARGNKSTSRTVRVDVDVLDNLMSLVGELVIDRTRLLQVLTRLEAEQDDDDLTQIMSSALGHIGRMTSDLQEEIQRARMLPVDNLFRKFPRMVRDTALRAGKEIEFVVLGEETELDRSVIEEIGDPLMHLLRNAVDHGIEPPGERRRAGKPVRGTMTLEANHEENHIIISVRDDGRGMDPEKIRASAVRKGLISEEAARRMLDNEVLALIWVPGFSTAEKVSDISGRGVGLDVVHRNIEKLNGSVEIKSNMGTGTEFRVKLPLTLAIIRSLQVQVRGTTYCLPLSSVLETDRIERAEVQTLRQREVIVKRGEVIPLLHLIDAFELDRSGDAPSDELFVVIVSVIGKQVGIVVDGLIGEGDVVIKPLGKFIGDVPGISGATILGDGDVAIILDISSLVNSVQAEMNREEAARR